MRRQLFFILCLAGLLGQRSVSAEEFHIFAPSRKGGELVIMKFGSQGEKAELKLIGKLDLGFGCRTICQHPTKPLLYVSGGAQKGSNSKENLAVHFLDAETNKLNFAEILVAARDYSYLSVDRTGNWLFGCNYGEGIVDVYRLDDNGVPNIEPVTTIDEKRKAAHCVLISPDNRNLYIPYVKDSNALFQYSFDADSGSVTALDPANVGPPEGTGPRHLAYHPSLPKLYFSEEQGLGVSIYNRDASTGGLSYLKSVNANGDDAPSEGVSASDIVVTPAGKFLYTGIRGHRHDYDFIACYKVTEEGDVVPIELVKTSEIPWGLAVSPDGKYLVVTAFKGAEIIVYRIDADGSLTKVANHPVDEGISDVEIR